MVMKKSRTKFNTTILGVSFLATLGLAGGSLAQSADDSDPIIRLYVDPATHIVYTVPGRGRRLLAEVPASALSNRALEQRQDQTDHKLDQDRARIAGVMGQKQQLEGDYDALST